MHKHIKVKRETFIFNSINNESPQKVKIILNDFADYPLFRQKYIFQDFIQCGIGNILQNMMKFDAGISFEVILIINEKTKNDRGKYTLLKIIYPFIDKIIFRDNTGFNFGAYNRGYQYLKEIGYDDYVVFMNSSARGPDNHYWLLNYYYLFNTKEDIGLCGVSLNSHTTHLNEMTFKPHIQSFFMFTSMQILKDVFVDDLPAADLEAARKIERITKGEIEFSNKILMKEYGIRSILHKKFVYYRGCDWKIPYGDPRHNPLYSQFANKI